MGESRRSERLKVIGQVSNWAALKTEIGPAKVDGHEGENWMFQKVETERYFRMKLSWMEVDGPQNTLK